MVRLTGYQEEWVVNSLVDSTTELISHSRSVICLTCPKCGAKFNPGLQKGNVEQEAFKLLWKIVNMVVETAKEKSKEP